MHYVCERAINRLALGFPDSAGDTQLTRDTPWKTPTDYYTAGNGINSLADDPGTKRLASRQQSANGLSRKQPPVCNIGGKLMPLRLSLWGGAVNRPIWNFSSFRVNASFIISKFWCQGQGRYRSANNLLNKSNCSKYMTKWRQQQQSAEAEIDRRTVVSNPIISDAISGGIQITEIWLVTDDWWYQIL